MSSIRRKPQYTYRSPQAASSWMPSPHASSSSSSSSSSQSPAEPQPPLIKAQSSLFKRPTALTLPLYHPLGRLALSLPPLDPTLFGFPATVCIDDDNLEGRVAPRKPEAVSEPPSTSAIAVAADHEVKETHIVTPRKRRGGKRKRKDPEEADTTYPAKKTRQTTRGPSNTSHVHEPSPLAEVQSVATPEPVVTPDEKKRTTRSKGQSSRRSPNWTEGSPGSVSVPPTPAPIKDVNPERASDVEGTPDAARSSSSKEEGEITDDDKRET
ncbi:hypothetical protein BDZ89DRAFT_1056906 [Hymenopellis radicata]|nr:hypothetical protein BDZ89DRAFT_1056906 [Hymenopellis radicata]